MERSGQSINRNALASLICGFLSPLLFAVFVAIGALQEIGYDIFIESYRYEDLARVAMLMLSAESCSAIEQNLRLLQVMGSTAAQSWLQSGGSWAFLGPH
jgi:hypothetical protein